MKNDFVHQLVHSLTKSEKRYFKLFSQVQSGTKNYLKLFDALESLVTYDSKQLRKKLKGSPMNLSYEKKYLGKMLLKSLRNFEGENSPLYQVGNMMQDVEL